MTFLRRNSWKLTNRGASAGNNKAWRRGAKWFIVSLASLMLGLFPVVFGQAAYAAGPSEESATQAMQKWGWTPMPSSMPPFVCTDDSYARAVRDGVTFGTYDTQPYLYKTTNGEPAGYEWDLLKATLDYAGISNIKLLYADYGTLLPGLLAKRLDLFPAHETPERLKLISFTGPVYWYGPAIAVPAGNPAKIQTYDDLVRADVTVGVVSGSAEALYMERVHGHIVPYTGGLLELASLADSRESAILEDAPVVAAYLKSKPDSKIQVLSSVQLPPTTLAALGYSYFRWGIRKEDCSLGLAISRALLEVRANGVVRTILEKSGMGDYAKVNIPGLSD
jgi:polar amino acid transport system substrate-binding protein